MEDSFIDKIKQIILDNLDDEKFGVNQLAAKIGLSKSQTFRKVKSLSNKSVNQFIKETRLQEAAKLILNTNLNASEISYKVGFSSPSYFNKCFSKYYGITPGEYKEKNKEMPSINTLDQQGSQPRIKKIQTIFYTIGAAVLLFGIITFFKSESNSNTYNPSEISIAVLPFKNYSGNPDMDAFCDGMTDEVISRLAKIKSLSKVTSLTSVLRYKKSDKSMPEIAKELGVNNILEGNFQKSGDKIKINLQLIHGPSDHHFWSQEYYVDWQSKDIFTIQAEVAELVAKQLDADISQEELVDIRKSKTYNPEAYDYYLRGKYKKSDLSLNNVLGSIRYFEKAIELDSLFVDPYISLWGSYIVLGSWHGNMSKKKADSLGLPYFEKALQLDPDNIKLLHGLANSNYYKWNFKFADSLYKVLRKRGFKYVYDQHLNLMFGRNNLVIKNAKKLFKEDEYNTMASHMTCAYAYYSEGQIDSTLYMIREGLRIHPFQEAYYDHFGNLFIDMGDYKKAKNVLEKGLEISDQRHASMLVHLAIIYHYLDDEEKSLSYLNEVIKRAKAGEPEINVFLSHYYSRLGNFDEAFKWLDIAYKKHEVDLIWLKADPNLILLKEDPRYELLCEKVGFNSIN